MNDETRRQILAHARQEFPREACGLVLIADGYERYQPCRNLATNQKDFILDPADYAAAEDLGEIIAVVHSHPKTSPRPSQADRVGCEASGLPWHIVSIPSETWETIQPEGYRAPLIGREFSHGLLDCYSLVRDWYLQERGQVLPDFDRVAEEWWLKGYDLYEDNFRAQGFEPIPDGAQLEVGDLILMQIRSKVVNHAAVYIGRDQIIQHLQGRLSSRDVYGGYWKRCTRLVIRYRGTP